MKTFVITLKEYKLANQLMARCIESGLKFNWNIETFWAIDGKTITFEHLQEMGFQIDKASKIFERKGAIGAFLSHHTLWKRCIELNEPIIVLESDVIITGYLPKLDLESSIVKLHHNRSTKTSDVTGTWTKGAYAYAISPRFAGMLVEKFYQVPIKPADKAIGDKIVPFIHLDKPIVEHRGVGPSTTAGTWHN